MSEERLHSAQPQSGLTAMHLLLLLFFGCAAGYLVLRTPELREALLRLTPHRLHIEKTVQQRLLAPRSVLSAGLAAGGVIGSLLLFRRGRASLRLPLPCGAWPGLLFVGTQAAVLIAVVANLHAVYLRLYEGRPLWNLAEEEVLAHDLPHTWPDGRALKKVLPPDARVGLRVWPKDEANGISEPFMLHSWAYPIALFDLYPKTENWREDATFSKAAEKYRLQYLLEYRQSDRTNPLRLEPLR